MPLIRGLPGFDVRLRLGSKCSQRSPIFNSPHYPKQSPIGHVHSVFAQSLATTSYTRSTWYHSENALSSRLTMSTTSRPRTRQHSGHSHHHHHHDTTYLTSTNKKDAGVRITRIGLFVNLLMATGKGLGGYLFNSQALVADAFHSLTDLVSDFLTLATVAWSLKPPSERFPAGYGKIESLGSLGVSSLLLAGGIGLGWHSVEILFSQFFSDAAAIAAEHSHGHDHTYGAGIFGHSHSHNPAEMGIPNVHAAWIAGGSIIVKEYLYRASE